MIKNCVLICSWVILAIATIYCDTCQATNNNVLISWGDYVILYGMGTDSALDSPEGIRRVMERWKGRGYTGVYWRSDFEQHDPNEIIRQYDNLRPISYGMVKIIDQAAKSFDVITTARQIAEELGLDFWVYHTGVYMDGASADSDVTHPWAYVTRYIAENPEALTVDRNGKPYYSVREYAYPGAIENKVNEYTYMAKNFGIKNFYAAMRSEAEQMQATPSMADQYGFNQPIVDEMQSRYGINILTDPRFDINNPSFDPEDPMVENWHRLRGEYLTEFWRQLRIAMDAIDPNIRITTRIPGGDHIGPSFGNWILDWRTWINEGLLDELILYGPLGQDPDAASKKYLMDTYPVSTFRNFVDTSNNPDTKLIIAGQGVYIPRPNLAGSDGWRIVWGPEAYDLAWYQRWQKWKADIRDFDGIRYIMQDFDDFAIKESGYDKGWGNMLYDNDLRACQGYWYTQGYDTDAVPIIQDKITRGDQGKALELIASQKTSMPLLARHWSDWLFVDPSVSVGNFSFEYWIFRPNSGSSFSVMFEYDAAPSQKGPAMHIGTGVDGLVSYYQNSSWVQTDYTIPTSSWVKIRIKADLENKTYSIFTGPDDQTIICSDVPYSHEQNRFNQLRWVPEMTSVYIDDVLWLWEPNMPYTPHADQKYLVNDFERNQIGLTAVGTNGKIGPRWQCNDGQSNYYIENQLSFGEGYKCLAAKKEAGSYLFANTGEPIIFESGEVITVDCDVFVPVGSSISIELRKSQAAVTAGALFSNDISHWCGQNEAYISTGSAVIYDKWMHLQIAIDNSKRTYSIVTQLPGKLPNKIITAEIDSGTNFSDQVYLMINPQGSDGTVSYLDNIVVTYGNINVCGDEYHPHPVGDINKDCRVNLIDFSMFAENWMNSKF